MRTLVFRVVVNADEGLDPDEVAEHMTAVIDEHVLLPVAGCFIERDLAAEKILERSEQATLDRIMKAGRR